MHRLLWSYYRDTSVVRCIVTSLAFFHTFIQVSLQILNKAVDRLKKILPTKKPKETPSTEAPDEKNKNKSGGTTFSQPGNVEIEFFLSFTRRRNLYTIFIIKARHLPASRL